MEKLNHVYSIGSKTGTVTWGQLVAMFFPLHEL